MLGDHFQGPAAALARINSHLTDERLGLRGCSALARPGSMVWQRGCPGGGRRSALSGAGLCLETAIRTRPGAIHTLSLFSTCFLVHMRM